jgi:hypothetical protein
MKKIFFLMACAVAGVSGFSQDFSKDLASAGSSYSSGDLQSARSALEQLLSDVDAAIGKEILTMLPTTIGSLNYNQKDDNVSGGTSSAGLYVHRTYGASPKAASIDIINNSPMIASINAVLNTPLIGGMMQNNNQKVVKVQGYKAMLTRNDNSNTGKTSYDLQIPFSNTLLTFHLDDTDEGEVTQLSNNIPLAKIGQMAQ